jgi:hypothetical protein
MTSPVEMIHGAFYLSYPPNLPAVLLQPSLTPFHSEDIPSGGVCKEREWNEVLI